MIDVPLHAAKMVVVKIDSYRFGQIVIDGAAYSSDVIITPGGVRGRWWRKDGHIFSLDDLRDAFAASPKKLILGTGASGMCRVAQEVRAFCDANHIELCVSPTKEAVAAFNSEDDKSRLVAALHLTC